MTLPALISVLALIVSGLAYYRAGRQYAEDQRDRLLSRVIDLNIDVWQRESELVALEHTCASANTTAEEVRARIQTETAIWRAALVEQKSQHDALHSEIAFATGKTLRKRLREWRIQIDKQVPLQAGQMKDVAEHIRKSTCRLEANISVSPS